MDMGYERIRFNGSTVILRDPREIEFLGTKALSGIEVDETGAEISARGTDERRHIIALALISRRTPLEFDKHYGTLVKVGR